MKEVPLLCHYSPIFDEAFDPAFLQATKTYSNIIELLKKSLELFMKLAWITSTGRFTRLGRCFLDWATAVAGEGDTRQLSVSFTCHGSGPT